MMNKKFKNILDRFYEGIFTEDISLERNDLENFYDDIFKVNNDSLNILNRFILDESEEHVDYRQPVLDMLMNARFSQQISYWQILEKLNPSWMYFNDFYNCEKRFPCYVFQIDFSNPVKAYDMFKFFSFEYAKEIGNEQIVKEFKENINESIHGFVKDLDDSFILVFDDRRLNKLLVAYELTHYFQKTIGKNILNEKNDIKNSLDNLQLSNKQLNYFFSSDEFFPNLYVNMIENFKKFYHLKYFKIQKEEFIECLLKNIENYKDRIFESDFGKSYLTTMKESSSIQMLAASYILNIGYDKIVSILKREFKD